MAWKERLATAHGVASEMRAEDESAADGCRSASRALRPADVRSARLLRQRFKLLLAWALLTAVLAPAAAGEEVARRRKLAVDACIADKLAGAELLRKSSDTVDKRSRALEKVQARAVCSMHPAQAVQWPHFKVARFANAHRLTYHPAQRRGAPFTSADTPIASTGEAAAVEDASERGPRGIMKTFPQFAFSSDGHSFAADAFLHDAGLGETGEGGVVLTPPDVRGRGAGAAQRDDSSGRSGGGVVAIILSSNLEETPAPMPLRCSFATGDDAGTTVGVPQQWYATVETPAELHLFGTRYAQPEGASKGDHYEFMHVYTILCPLPAEFVLRVAGPTPAHGKEGEIVDGARLSLRYYHMDTDNATTAKDVAWMQPLTFRDMRIAPSPAAPPAMVDCAMCLSGVFGIGGGRFLPEYIEYHRALGVGLFEFFDMDSSGAAATQLEGYARSGVVRLRDWSAVPGVQGFVQKRPPGMAPWKETDEKHAMTRVMQWRHMQLWYQGHLVTHNLCYWTLRRRAKYILINDIDEVLALWRKPHTLQRVLMPWMERAHNESGGRIRGFSLENRVAPPNLISAAQLGGQRPANGSCDDDCELLSQSLLAALTHEQIRTTHNVGTYHDGRWKYMLRVAEEDNRAHVHPIYIHAIYFSFPAAMADVLDRVMTLVPTYVAYLRHLVPYPRLAKPPSDFDFPTRGYGFKPLPKAPILSAMRVRVALRRAGETRARGLQECV